jgi:dCMP deaminase
MIVLNLENKAMAFLKKAAEVALESSCLRSKCGSVIVKDEKVIGSGYNSPPLDKKLSCCFKDSLPDNFVSDRTCCVHAEQRAIMDALKNNPSKIAGSRLYFIRLDERGGMAVSGDPYCTICSKIALDSGIAEFILLRKEGICVYDTEEYNRKSFNFQAI